MLRNDDDEDHDDHDDHDDEDHDDYVLTSLMSGLTGELLYQVEPLQLILSHQT